MPISHRHKLRLLSAALAVVATAASAFIQLPAVASAATPDSGSPESLIADPVALLGRLAPELLRQTSVPPGQAQTAEIAAQTGAMPFTAGIAADAAAGIRLSPAQTEGTGQPVGVTIDDARGQARQSDGITSFTAGPEAQAAAYVQPIMNGVRLMTAIASPSAGDDFSYRFDLPEGSSTRTIPGGDTIVTDAAFHYIGTVEAPWAIDSAGQPLETGYSWSGSTLTQHVELADDTVYPVLIDPVWFYSYDFSATLPGYHAVHPTASESAVDRLLHGGCFNCYFPISGAPRTYPVDGQILPLNASPFSLEALAAPVRMQTANGGAMQFLAQAGHFDGAGSLITFSWYNDPSGYLHLYVHAKIMRDLGPTLNIINSRIAGANWLLYWQRVADNANGSSGGGGV
ncbi:hypothetical protein [Herbiconiux daphne]|uniref:Uncharacterized protein n=1 Tax=Herbiconiux daphne TaxID=2970914 RepID=A0ABT2H184_9MICO|nr:hypothetical protein [Herbiconiux daphne]MCS5733698.1 hypothetical protein [Herbiconiux daphne]